MRFRIYGMVLSLFFALGLVFSFGIEASADHGSTGIAAGDVDSTDRAEVEDFLDHVIDYYDQVVADNAGDTDALNRELVIYGRALRQEGPYKNVQNNMYSMALNSRGHVTNHAIHFRLLFGHQFDSAAAGSAVASTIQDLIDGSGVGMTHCEENYDGQGRVACATKVSSASGIITVIAGLHHEADDAAFVLPDTCNNFTLDTTAEEVYNDHTKLEDYVKGIIGAAQQLMLDSTDAAFEDPDNASLLTRSAVLLQDPQNQDGLAAAAEFQAKIFEQVYDRIACFSSGDFKHKNIYAFIMSTDMAGTVLLNGNNFDLNGLDLQVNDDELPGNDKSIAGLFRNALTGGSGEPQAEDFATVNYRWDDPDDPGDDVPNFFEDGKVPGTSPKTSYIEVANITKVLKQERPLFSSFPDFLYIFGSGTYPEEEMMPEEMMPEEMMPEEMMPEEMMPEEMMPEEMMPESDDDDGCAIAGTGHTSQSTLLNLFLIASVLFSVVFLRRRA